MQKNTDEPVHIFEDENTGGRFLVYETKDGPKIDIRFDGDSLWMTQAQIAGLFGRDQSTISKHIFNIFEEDELDETTSMQKVHKSQGRPATVYSLDIIISVGYRVSSRQATVFRRWATSVLVQFAKKGFVVDSVRLKQPENADRVRELREIIRDIRSDEANLYRELKSVCAMCQDYDGNSDTARKFYQHTQAKFVYAVTSRTPAELVVDRADHSAENMGLTNWPNENVRKNDVAVSKNYLADREIRELNRLTDILLTIFEDQLDMGRLVVIADAQRLLEKQLGDLGRPILRSGGSIKSSTAKQLAEEQYDKFNTSRKIKRYQEADKSITELAIKAKALPKAKR